MPNFWSLLIGSLTHLMSFTAFLQFGLQATMILVMRLGPWDLIEPSGVWARNLIPLQCLDSLGHSSILHLKNPLFTEFKEECMQILTYFDNSQYRNSSLKQKSLEIVSRQHFLWEFFDGNLPFVILHKLAKFHYQTKFTSQVIK